jgi:hypothetical protein
MLYLQQKILVQNQIVFFHHTDESIYSMGFVEGYEVARAQNI